MYLSVHCGNQMSRNFKQRLASIYPFNFWTIMLKKYGGEKKSQQISDHGFFRWVYWWSTKCQTASLTVIYARLMVGIQPCPLSSPKYNALLNRLSKLSFLYSCSSMNYCPSEREWFQFYQSLDQTWTQDSESDGIRYQIKQTG